MSDLVIFKDATGRLEGFGEKGRRAWAKFKKIIEGLEVGETMQFGYRLPRSPNHHKFVFARFQALLERQETFSDLDHLIVFLKVGAGAAALAAAMAQRESLQGRSVGVTLCGGNVDTAVFARVLAGHSA